MIAFLTDGAFGLGVGLAVGGGLFSKNGLFSGRPKFFGKYCSKSVPRIDAIQLVRCVAQLLEMRIRKCTIHEKVS